MASADAEPAVPAAPAPSGRRCENCGTPLLGEHCYACGQPVHGLMRNFSSVIGDFFDTVFDLDSRVLRTLGPLLLRPGYLSLEYFAGRRVRYVTPMRLFLFLSLLAFFAIHARIDTDADVKVGPPKNGVTVETGGIESASTIAGVEAARDQALKGLDQGLQAMKDLPGGAAGLPAIEQARQEVLDSAQARIAWLRESEAARAAGKPEPPPPSQAKARNKGITFPVNGKPWDPVTNPIAFAWLPQAGNDLLNRRMQHASAALREDDSGRVVVEALFNVLPQTLIVLMPIFALMLKLAYWFRRRLFMEHLIVALHSHAFIALALALVMLFSWLQELAAAGLAYNLLGWAIGLTAAWIPVYLLVMQKRVYGQGWPMTIVKFCVLGFLYSILVGVGLGVSMLVGLLTL